MLMHPFRYLTKNNNKYLKALLHSKYFLDCIFSIHFSQQMAQPQTTRAKVRNANRNASTETTLSSARAASTASGNPPTAETNSIECRPKPPVRSRSYGPISLARPTHCIYWTATSVSAGRVESSSYHLAPTAVARMQAKSALAVTETSFELKTKFVPAATSTFTSTAFASKPLMNPFKKSKGPTWNPSSILTKLGCECTA